jgi:hypothetical protein
MVRLDEKTSGSVVSFLRRAVRNSVRVSGGEFPPENVY